jgi:hypothetical protein
VSGSNAQNAVRGCLQGQAGNFTLRGDDGRIFQLTGDTSKLNDNVNKEVEITGNSGSSETSSNSAGQSTLNVTDVRKISDTCSSSGSAMPQSGSQPPSSSSQPPSGPSDPDQDTAANPSATPQTGAAATNPNGNAANTNQNPNATGANANGTNANAGTLPKTASPLPLMGLIGFGSLASGMVVRKFRK